MELKIPVTANFTDIPERVKFYECDHLGRFKPSAILKSASEVAGYDYTAKGLTHEFLWEHKMVFLVSQVSFKIFRNLSENTDITLRTWENGKKRAQFIRGFEIYSNISENRELAVQGMAGWILVNTDTKRIIKPADFPYPMPQREDILQCLGIGRIRSENLQFLGTRKVAFSDLDGNGHVYNSNYADFAMDFLPTEVFERPIDNFRINYNSETKLGDSIDIFGEILQEKAILSGKCNGKNCFECEIMYVKC
jgi:acyl-ACP thioesterase